MTKNLNELMIRKAYLKNLKDAVNQIQDYLIIQTIDAETELIKIKEEIDLDKIFYMRITIHDNDFTGSQTKRMAEYIRDLILTEEHSYNTTKWNLYGFEYDNLCKIIQSMWYDNYRFSKLIEGINITVEKDYFAPDISIVSYQDVMNNVFQDDNMTAVYIPLNADLDIIIK